MKTKLVFTLVMLCGNYITIILYVLRYTNQKRIVTVQIVIL